MDSPKDACQAEHPALTGFKCCPSCSSLRIVRREGKAVKCGDCGFEFFLNPAAAVGVVMEAPDGRVVLLRRAKEPGKGKLGIPGGFIDAFETVEDGARREVLEETGLHLPERLDYLGSCVNRYEYAGVVYASCDIYLHARMDSLEGILALDETEAIVLRDPKLLAPDELAFSSARQALAQFAAGR
jgi:NAD+ diphosphatase